MPVASVAHSELYGEAGGLSSATSRDYLSAFPSVKWKSKSAVQSCQNRYFELQMAE
jgi:hypothetical protein